MLTSSLDVGFYSYMWLWCLAIPDKRRRSLSPRFFICLNLGTWTDTQTIILITKLKTMKTKFFNYLLMGAFAIMSSVAFISCSSDNDDNSGGGGGDNGAPRDEYGVYTEGKKLSTYKCRDRGISTTFHYADNRLDHVSTDYNSYTYRWGDGKVEQIDDNGNTVMTYVIQNGLVTEVIPSGGYVRGTNNKITLSYNSNRQLVKRTNQWGYKQYTWNSGRVTKITNIDTEFGDSWDEVLEYEETCQQGYCPPTSYYGPFFTLDGQVDYLYSAHPELFGMRMNSLPSKVNDEGQIWKYDYIQNEEGYVVECKEEAHTGDMSSYTYTWE